MRERLLSAHCRLNQNLALKSSEQERKAAWVGEWTSHLTGPLWPSDKSCFLLAFLASQAQRLVVALHTVFKLLTKSMDLLDKQL